MTGSENPCWPRLRELSNPTACSHTSACIFKYPDISCLRVMWDLNQVKTVPHTSH
ncbi:hypothetical protein MXB_4563 [Myxobolus squamalis]|nr:hypothetical protein MXB_4563 [Myxobolus squamalis]